MPAIETGSVMVDGVSTFFRRIPGDGDPVVFAHGNPTHSEDWLPFLERMRGPAVAFDFPGWGRSERPPESEFDYSMHGLGRFTTRFLERMAIDRYSLVVHDWGAVALIAAQEDPERVRRLLIANAVPLLPGYRWHRVARIWRTPVLGEVSMRLLTRRLVDWGFRESRGDLSRHDSGFIDMVWDHWDRGTSTAILRLYRSADPDTLAAAGERLGTITAPTLVLWGLRERYLPPRFGAAYTARLPNAELLELPGAGHWPWLDDPSVIERMVRFLEPDDDSGGR